MTGLTVLAKASEEQQHSGDCEAITVYGEYVITGADDGKIKVWNKDLQLLREVQASDDAIQRVVVTNNVVYALSYRIVKAFEFESLDPRELSISPFKYDARVLKADDACLYVGDDTGTIYTFTLSGETISKIKLTEPLFELYMTQGRIFGVRDRGITIQELRKSGELTILQTLRGSYPMALWNDYLVAADQNDTKNLVVYNKDNYKTLYEIQGHELIVLCMCGWDNWLATGSYDKKLKLWDLNNGKLAAELELPGFVMSAVPGEGNSVYVGLKYGYVYKVKAG